MIASLDHTMVRLAEWLFGRPSSEAGEGVESTLHHTWPLPPSVTALLLIGAVVFVLVIYFREQGRLGTLTRIGLAAIRLALIGLIVFMMHEFFLRRYRTDLPELVVAIDDTESMQRVDHYERPAAEKLLADRTAKAGFAAPTRLSQALTLLTENDQALLAQLAEKYNLKIYRLGQTARALQGGEASSADALRALTAKEPASRLGAGMHDILQAQRGRPTAAVVVLTDGITTDGPTIAEAAQYARRKAVPLMLVGLGNDQPARDLAVGQLLASQVVFAGDVAPIDFQLAATGFEGRTVEVRLREKGQQQTLARTEVTLGPDGAAQPGRLVHRPQREGPLQLVVEVDPLVGEANADNNQADVTITVRNETIRVLMVQDYPSFEFRHLKNLLEREQLDEGGERRRPVQLTTVLHQADLEYADTDRTAQRVFPVQREQLLDNFDVIVFGDVNPSFLSRSVQENIAAFVRERGGGVVFIAGPRFTPLAYRDTPLAELLPIDLATATVPPPETPLRDEFAVRLSPLGLSAPPLQLADSLSENADRWRKLPGLYWMLRAPDVKPGTRVLVEHASELGGDGRPLPVVCTQFVGAGRVVLHTTDETWRWSFRSGGPDYARYWLQTLRTLSYGRLGDESSPVRLTTDRDDYRRGESVQMQVRFFDARQAPPDDDGAQVVLEQTGQRNRRITLRRTADRQGVFQATVAGLADGQYHAWLASPSLGEAAPACDFVVTAPAGESARVEMDAAGLREAAETSQGKFYRFADAARLLDDLPRGRQVRIDTLPPEPIWNSWKLAAAFVVLIVAEWLLRKRAGLL